MTSIFCLQNQKVQWFFITSLEYIFNEIEDDNGDKNLRLQVRKEISTENANISKMIRQVLLYR